VVRTFRLWVYLGAWIGLLAGAAVPARATLTLLRYVSEPGDYIGQGETHEYTPADGTFTASRNFDDGVQIYFNGTSPSVWWYANFAAPFSVPLTPGYYPNATRWPFQDNDEPGLDFSGSGRGCNTLIGEFTILEAVYNPDESVLHFAATFEQHCEGADPALFGEVYYNSTVPEPATLVLVLVGGVAALRRRRS